LSFMVGMMGNSFAFIGTDAAFHVRLPGFRVCLYATGVRCCLPYCRCLRKL
jgi:hypothetical protein